MVNASGGGDVEEPDDDDERKETRRKRRGRRELFAKNNSGTNDKVDEDDEKRIEYGPPSTRFATRTEAKAKKENETRTKKGRAMKEGTIKDQFIELRKLSDVTERMGQIPEWRL